MTRDVVDDSVELDAEQRVELVGAESVGISHVHIPNRLFAKKRDVACAEQRRTGN